MAALAARLPHIVLAVIIDRAAAASVRKLVVGSFWRCPTQHGVANASSDRKSVHGITAKGLVEIICMYFDMTLCR